MSDSKGDSSADVKKPSHFIRNIIMDDLSNGSNDGRLVTRFPPEPNGFLHIGHAKSICLNFGIAEEFEGGKCNLRFDDTNPEKESQTYINAIKEDVSWLGYKWAGDIHYASDYFQQIYEFAVELINKGLAYICDLTSEQAREYRGTLTEPGRNSPGRERTIEENLDLFERMKAGEFEDGRYSLRAKIDMASPNMNLRDPVLYRIRHISHHQTGTDWCIYPMYDFTHPISDALEGITHSLCTLEFEDHRPLYDWVVSNVSVPYQPRQIEFSRLNLNYTVTSKRKLKRLVDEGFVDGWDDPRMPTLAGLRRRGYTPLSIRQFCESVGVTKSDSVVDMSQLEFAIRDDLNERSPRAMCVLNPLKVVLENYPQEQRESVTLPLHPQNESMGTRQVTWGREVYIDQADFAEEPPRKWKRLAPGKSVRLRGGYVITCQQVVKNDAGEIVELRCTYDENTLGVKPEGYKVNGVVHWVNASLSTAVEVRLYDRLFSHESPDSPRDDTDFVEYMNPESRVILENARLEDRLIEPQSKIPYQFEREGYFFVDKMASEEAGKLVFNRTVTLRDSWAKMAK